MAAIRLAMRALATMCAPPHRQQWCVGVAYLNGTDSGDLRGSLPSDRLRNHLNPPMLHSMSRHHEQQESP